MEGRGRGWRFGWLVSVGVLGLGVVHGADLLTLEDASAAVRLRIDLSGAAEVKASDGTQAALKVTQDGAGKVMTLHEGPIEVVTVAPGGKVGVGDTTPDSRLTVAGRIETTAGGVKFPDGTTQTTAAGASIDNWYDAIMFANLAR